MNVEVLTYQEACLIAPRIMPSAIEHLEHNLLTLMGYDLGIIGPESSYRLGLGIFVWGRVPIGLLVVSEFTKGVRTVTGLYGGQVRFPVGILREVTKLVWEAVIGDAEVLEWIALGTNRDAALWGHLLLRMFKGTLDKQKKGAMILYRWKKQKER